MSVVLSEHLPLLASAPDGIQKLRGLNLELAVRGKLVPQDPNDEPASELVKRIAQERARLEAEGIRKKSKPVRLASNASQPSGWISAVLPDLCEIGGGATPSKAKSAYWDEGLPWVSPKDMKVDLIFDAQDHVTELALRETRLPRVPTGSLLIVVRGMILAHSFPVATTQVDVAINQDMKSLTPLIPELQPFLALALKGWKPQILALVDRSTHGTCKLQSETLFAFEFGIPPLAEQHRIAAKVDELMALCDRLEAEQTDAETAHVKLVETLLGTLTQSTDAAELAANWQRLAEHFDTLFTTESSLDTLKQTILQLAVMGKLVPQDLNDEPASELLKRIAKERARLEAEGRIRKSKSLPSIGEGEQPYALPENWSWSRLGQSVIESGAGWSPSCESRPRENDEWGVLKVSAVSWGAFNPAENKALPVNLEPRPEHEVVAGDFLVSRANTADLVARSVVVEDCPRHLMLSDKIVRLKLSQSVSGQFVNLANSCVHARNYYAAVPGAAVWCANGLPHNWRRVSSSRLQTTRSPKCRWS